MKKKKLIPDKQEKKTVAKAPAKVKRKQLIPSDKKTAKRKSSTRKKTNKELVNFITEEKREYRKTLREKFNAEIIELVDKSVQLVVFKLGAEEYALEISRVKEVVITPEISKVPRMPDYVKGLADIRGQTVVLVDLALKFGLPTSEDLGYTLVIVSKKIRVGLMLPNLPIALNVEGKNISSIMSYLTETASEETHVKALIKLEERLIYFLDVDELLSNEMITVVPNHLIDK